MVTPGLSVWVVDDDESVRWVLEQALKQAHMIPRCFESGDAFFRSLHFLFKEYSKHLMIWYGL